MPKSKTKKYIGVIFCQNCRTRYECEIPKGDTVWDFLETSEKLNKCGNCGCQIVQSRYNVWGVLLK